MEDFIYMSLSGFKDSVVAINTKSAISMLVISSHGRSSITVKDFKVQNPSPIEAAFDALAYYHDKGFAICCQTWFETIRLKALVDVRKNIYDLQLLAA